MATFTFIQAGGRWENRSNWDAHALPKAHDTALLVNVNATIDSNVKVAAVSLDQSDLTVESAGSLSGALTATDNSSISLLGYPQANAFTAIDLDGSQLFQGVGAIITADTLTETNHATLDMGWTEKLNVLTVDQSTLQESEGSITAKQLIESGASKIFLGTANNFDTVSIDGSGGAIMLLGANKALGTATVSDSGEILALQNLVALTNALTLSGNPQFVTQGTTFLFDSPIAFSSDTALDSLSFSAIGSGTIEIGQTNAAKLTGTPGDFAIHVSLGETVNAGNSSGNAFAEALFSDAATIDVAGTLDLSNFAHGKLHGVSGTGTLTIGSVARQWQSIDAAQFTGTIAANDTFVLGGSAAPRAIKITQDHSIVFVKGEKTTLDLSETNIKGQLVLDVSKSNHHDVVIFSEKHAPGTSPVTINGFTSGSTKLEILCNTDAFHTELTAVDATHTEISIVATTTGAASIDAALGENAIIVDAPEQDVTMSANAASGYIAIGFAPVENPALNGPADLFPANHTSGPSHADFHADTLL